MGIFDRLFGKSEKREVYTMPISEYQGLANYGFAQTPNQIKITDKTALSLSAVWASVKIPSESLASVPRGVYQRDKKGNSILATTSPAYKLMLKPNPFMNGFTWQLCMGYSYRLKGNAYSQIVRDGNNYPTELIPIHPDRVEVKFENGEIVYRVDNNLTIKAADMLHFKGLTSDGYTGISPIAAEAQNLGLALSTQAAQKNYYEKGTSLDGVLIHPGNLNIETAAKTIKAWKNDVSGTDGDRVKIVDGGFQYHQLKITAAEMQFLEARSASIPDIARIFTMPLHKLAHLGASTNNNIEQQGIDYVTDTCMPFAACFEAELEDKLLLSFEKPDHFIKYNLNGLMRGDYKSRIEGYRIWHSMGVPLNQLLALDDINPVEGGDKSLVPLNMISSDKLDEYHFAKNEDKNTSNTPRETKQRDAFTIDELYNELK